MKFEKILTCLWCAVVAFLLAFGAVGALGTGFDMDAGSAVPMIVGLAAVFFSLCFSIFGGAALALGALALVCGFVWRTGDLVPQTQMLLYRISSCYNSAYGWGILSWNAVDLNGVPVTVPLILIGMLIALTVAWTMCCRRRMWLAAGISLLPLILCVVVTDTVPKEETLFLFFLGMILLLLTQTVRRDDVTAGNRLTAILMVPAALMLVLLFWLVPREKHVPLDVTMGDQLIQWYQELRQVDVQERVSEWISGVFGGETVEEVNLKTTGRRSEYQYKVMEVVAAKTGLLYLRGMAYDTYDGYSWTVSQGNWVESDSFYPLYGNLNVGETAGEVEIRTRSVHGVLYFPYAPGTGSVGKFQNGSYLNREGWTTYSFEQLDVDDYLDADGRISSPSSVDQEKMKQYLQLPENTRERAEVYLREYLETVFNDDARYQILNTAEEIRRLVSGSADYDLNTDRMPEIESDFAMWFLEESDTGYCVHFATAATVLLRAAGVPARYVTGYLVDGVAEASVTVREADSHAWVEYWHPDLGWLKLEPTPGNGTDEVPDSQTDETRLPETTAQVPDTDATGPGTQQTPTTVLDVPGMNGTVNGEDTSEEIGKLIGTIISFTTLILLLLVVQWKLRTYLKKKWTSRGTTNEQALRKWRELERVAGILHTLPPEELEQLAMKAKFSQHELTESELIQLENQLARYGAEIRSQYVLRGLFVRLLYAVD